MKPPSVWLFVTAATDTEVTCYLMETWGPAGEEVFRLRVLSLHGELCLLGKKMKRLETDKRWGNMIALPVPMDRHERGCYMGFHYKVVSVCSLPRQCGIRETGSLVESVSVLVKNDNHRVQMRPGVAY